MTPVEIDGLRTGRGSGLSSSDERFADYGGSVSPPRIDSGRAFFMEPKL